MHITAATTSTKPLVEPADLVCLGCLASVRCEPPACWQDGGPAPGFSHLDGTALCHGQAGRACEPVEITLTSGW